MRIERVDLVAFGPFRDRRLELAPGMCVIHGGNEAGKSALHAALATGLCGVRRARGKTKEEQAFEERHRPWAGAGWKVRVLLHLADGRRIDVVQDLDEKSACRAYDADLGRDVSHEVQSTDWTPDATRWLGIDRRAFLAVASVRQAELLALRNEAEGLREFVQRAVTNAAADSTAARAIAHIDTYLSEHVGSRAASHGTKPLREAQRCIEAARLSLDRAQQDHALYDALLAREDAAAMALQQATDSVRASRAAMAAADVVQRRRIVARVRELQARFPNGAPAGMVADDELAHAVVKAVQMWAHRPALPVLEGLTADDLRQEIAALGTGSARVVLGAAQRAEPGHVLHAVAASAAPQITAGTLSGAESEVDPRVAALAALNPALAARPDVRAALQAMPLTQPHAPHRGTPSGGALRAASGVPGATARPAPSLAFGSFGDSEAAPEVLSAATRFEATRNALRAHAAQRPDVTDHAPGGRASLEELRELAARLAAPEPAADRSLDQRLGDLERRLASGETRAGVLRRIGVGALALGLVCATVFLVRNGSFWILAAGAAGALAILAFGFSFSGNSVRNAWTDEAEHLKLQRGVARQRAHSWNTSLEDARDYASELGVVPDAAILQRLANERTRWEELREQKLAWDRANLQLQREFEQYEDELRVQLADRGVVPGPNLLESFDEYVRSCGTRSRQRDLETRLERRLQDEAGVARVAAEQHAAAAGVHEVSQRCGISAADPETAARTLQDWLDQRSHAFADREQAERAWGQLSTLCDGRTPAELEAELAAAEAEVANWAHGLDPASITACPALPAEMARRQALQTDADRDLAVVRAELTAHAERSTSLADAEDELRTAEAELQRVTVLEATLRQTQDFLKRAQERVHRDVAPVLAAGVRTALPAITRGRYLDVRVDPETLDVQVQDQQGDWRRAALLSHGTAEQVYLLLRAALTRHLVRTNESCPLVLDDVTVQFDRHRKIAVLDWLHTVAHDRQVLLFTQEDAVLDWARAQLVRPQDGWVSLETAPQA